MKRVVVACLCASLFLVPGLMVGQDPCGPIRYFDETSSKLIYSENLTTSWFGVRMTPFWDARIDTAFFGFGIQRNSGIMVVDSLEVRILDSTLPIFTILSSLKLAVPAGISGNVKDDYYIVELGFSQSPPQIEPPRDFWLSWRLKGSSLNVARIILRHPTIEPLRSVMIRPNGTTQVMTDYVHAQIQDSVDHWAEVRACYYHGFPVELQTFRASYSSGRGILEWTTASETNNFGFEVERVASRTEDGQLTLWQKIGFVTGNGSTAERHIYRFIDADPAAAMDANGTVRYRLRQIDYDGTSELSSVREIRIGPSEGGIVLHPAYPNPAGISSGQVTVSFTIPVPMRIRLELRDVLGRLVLPTAEYELDAGFHSLPFAIDALAPGSYVCVLSAGDVRLMQPLLITP